MTAPATITNRNNDPARSSDGSDERNDPAASADAVVVELGVDVQVREHVVVHGEEPGQAMVQFRDPDVAGLEHDVSHPRTVFGRRVQRGQVPHARVARVREQRRDGQRIIGHCGAQGHPGW